MAIRRESAQYQFDNGILTDTIDEVIADRGVTIESVLHKDGCVCAPIHVCASYNVVAYCNVCAGYNVYAGCNVVASGQVCACGCVSAYCNVRARCCVLACSKVLACCICASLSGGYHVGCFAGCNICLRNCQGYTLCFCGGILVYSM